MLYDPSRAGESFKKRVAVVLGLWHPAKMLMLLIWRRFLLHFWAPYQHFLSPKSKVFKKPKTSRMFALFAYARTAYEHVQNDFRALILDITLTPTTRSVIQNLVDMFEYYLPLVCFPPPTFLFSFLP